MVAAHNGRYWQTVPGKYGVDRVVAWAKLPPLPSTKAAVEIEHEFQLSPSDIHQEGK